ncbi:hypothetical protein BsWGS_05781 [Bradybaena similaris]
MVCNRSTYASLLLALLLIALVQTSLSQNYHFSNGWYPGKKRSLSAAGSDSAGSRRSTSSYGAFEDACILRPEAVVLINRILQDEAVRMQRTCSSDASSGLTDILETAASKLESEGKW